MTTFTAGLMRNAEARAAGAVQVLWATFLRDVATATSYRVGFMLTVGSSLISVLAVFFLSEAFSESVSPSMGAYGGDYFGFAVVGVAFSNLMALGLTGMAARIREGQMMGTLEIMLLSPNRLPTLLLSSALWPHAQALLTLAVLVTAGIALGVDVGRANVPVALLGLGLSVLAFNALGLFAAAIVIVIKQGNPVALLIGMASILLAGVFYPVSVLPDWLQGLGQLLPLTHALEVVRRSALAGEGVSTLWQPLLFLSVLTSLLLPGGAWACQRAVRIAQTDGSLSQY